MLFDRDKSLSIEEQRNLPLIFRKQDQQNNQTNRSLYKTDSQTSHMTINPQNLQLFYDKSFKNTLHPKNSFTSNDIKNNISIKKYLKKGEQINKSNAKKLIKLTTNLQQKSTKNLFFKLPNDLSINKIQNNIEDKDKSIQKNLKKIYLSQNKSKIDTLIPLQQLKSKNFKRLSSNISKFSQHKTIKKLVNQEVQTEKISPSKIINKNLKSKRTELSSKLTSTSPKINTFQTLEKLNKQSKLDQKSQTTKNKFINLSSILQKDEQQHYPPTKVNNFRYNNLQTKYLLNQSFSGQQSTAPSSFTNSYLDSMSKLSSNLNVQIQKIKKKSRYDFSPTSQQTFNKTIQDQNFQSIKNERQNQIYKPNNSKNKSRIKQFTYQKTNQKQEFKQLNSDEKINLNNNKKSNKSISLSIVPEQSETMKSNEDQNMNHYTEQFSKLQVIKQERGSPTDTQFFNNKKSISKKEASKKIDEVDQNFNRKNSKVDQMMQFPQINELKISMVGNSSQIKKLKIIHPIRNTFDHKQANWIIDSYNPKSKILQNISTKGFQIKKYRNGVYFGALNQNKKQGHGIIFYFNGKLYEGQFKNDLKNGNGHEEFPDGSRYQGQFKDGLKHGRGIFEWTNGQVYEGQWKQGKKNGSAIWKSSDGQSYIGQWKQGQVQGFGVYISKNGDRYQGQFKNSEKNGFGTERYANGQTYVGQYKKNRPNGQGEYFWANGNYYKGEFINHLRHGEGYFKDQKNNQEFKGQYRNDKKCGYGQLKSGKTTYVGNFENDYKHGYGQFYENDQCKFKGYFINGKHLQQEVAVDQVQQQQYTYSKIKPQTIQTIPQKPEMQINERKHYHFNTLNNKNLIESPNLNSDMKSRNTITLRNSRSPIENKSIDSIEGSLQRQNYKRACGCSKKH